MLQSKFKSLLTVPESIPLAEPIYLPRRGNGWRISDLEALSDDENSYELVRGDLYMMTPSSPVHGRYASRLAAALVNYVEKTELGEVFTAEPGFILQPEPEATVRAPDVAFIRKERIPPPEQQEGFWHLAPDLVVEIISPSESADSIQEKVRDYLEAGTRLIWLVYPRLRIVVEYQAPAQIRQFGPDDELDGVDVLPGFRYPLQALFRES